MKTTDFIIQPERSLERGWVYTIKHPDWEGRTPDFATAPGHDADSIRGAIEDLINEHTRQDITEGMFYDFGTGDGVCQVWLSTENQANYNAYLKAVELGAESITIKVTDAEGKPVYAVIPAADYSAFYLEVVAHIKACVERGWQIKDNIDYSALANRCEGV